MTAESHGRARRGARAGEPQDRRHRALSQADFGNSFAALGSLAYAGARVSAHVCDVQTGATLLTIDDRIVQPVGAIGSLLLLIEVSARLSAGESGFTLLDRVRQSPGTGTDSARHSELPKAAKRLPSLWNQLKVPALPVVDLAVLVGATGDAVATNALLRHVTLAAVRRRGETLGLGHTAVLDLVRAVRGPDEAPHFAVSSAAELAKMLAGLYRGEIVDQPTSARVLRWLGTNRGATLVAAALGPNVAREKPHDESFRWVSSLGLESGLRAEVGLMFTTTRAAAFAVIIEFDGDAVATQLTAVDACRIVGHDLLEYLAARGGP